MNKLLSLSLSVTYAFFQSFGTVPSVSEVLKMSVSMGAISL